MGLLAGSSVELLERPEGLVLSPATDKPAMTKVKGLWVHQGAAPKGFDWEQHGEQQRNRRDQEEWSR
jgi:hypothetical protein